MGGTGSPMPFIKDEPEEYQFDQNHYINMNGQNSFQQHHGHPYGNWQGSMGNDISDMSMGGQNIRQGFGSQQNLSSNFIGDDELADLLAETDPSVDNSATNMNGFAGNAQFNNHYGSNMSGSAAMPVQRNQYMNNAGVFSQTPEGAPIQSPFIHSFNYAQWATGNQQQSTGLPRRPSANVPAGSFDLSNRVRSSLGQDRTGSISRSPLTPRTPGQPTVQMSSPDTAAFTAGQPIRGHRKTSSSQWESGTFSSGPSYAESPMSSPHTGSMQAQIVDVMNSGRSSSVTPKMEPGAQSAPSATLEAKRQKRRQSHNAVERRRRDNINERIQELSHLVPQHRLEDDKLSKHIRSNSIFSPTLGPTSMSPPQATSLLAGGTGRRAAGGITQGLPVEDKDKGPAKGDVLNGAVAWTRDLMWLLNRQIGREAKLTEMLAAHGEAIPQYLRPSDDDRRMQQELVDAVQLNGPANFSYSRTNGSGLWVPKFTDHAGNPVQTTSGQQHQTGISGAGQMSNNDAQLWEYNNLINDDLNITDFKEEEEFGMELED